MLLEELTQLTGVSGYEKEVSKFIKKELAESIDSVFTDSLGNLIVLKKGSAQNKKKIMLCAHMDEIGLQVIKITDDGMIMVKSLGCSWMYTTYMARVRFRNGMVGVISSRVKPDKINNEFVNLFVDIGTASKEETLKYVDVGDVAAYIGPYQALAGKNVIAKALDDRVGCYIMIEAIKRLKETRNDVYFVFTVQEEEGCRGSKVTAERIHPDVGVAIDVTPGQDRPGDLEGSNTVGNGTAIKISDTSVICDEYLIEKMIGCCKRDNIKYQKDVIYVGGTDASSMNLSGMGVCSAGISVVTRYAHGPNSIVNLDDVEASINLLTAFVNEEFTFED